LVLEKSYHYIITDKAWKNQVFREKNPRQQHLLLGNTDLGELFEKSSPKPLQKLFIWNKMDIGCCHGEKSTGTAEKAGEQMFTIP